MEGDEVSLRLFRKPLEAQCASIAGFRRLCELTLGRELAWLPKDLRALEKLKPLLVTMAPVEELEAAAYAHLQNYLFEQPEVFPLTHAKFAATIERARTRLPGLAQRFLSGVGQILQLRQQLLLVRQPYTTLHQDLDGLVGRDFLRTTPFDPLQHLPRYLKGLLVRAERAALNPAKDRERARLVQPYVELCQSLAVNARAWSPARQNLCAEFRWLVEEFKISCFAQELGTPQPISAKRLDQFLERHSLLGGK